MTVIGAGASATVSWAVFEGRGVTYRVLRGLDDRKPGVDLTTPITAISFVDQKVEPGVTYFYQVIALYNRTEWPAERVAFTAPVAAQVILSTPVPRAMIRSITISTNAPGAFNSASWDMQRVAVTAVGGGGFTQGLVVTPGGSYLFTGVRPSLVIQVQ